MPSIFRFFVPRAVIFMIYLVSIYYHWRDQCFPFCFRMGGIFLLWGSEKSGFWPQNTRKPSIFQPAAGAAEKLTFLNTFGQVWNEKPWISPKFWEIFPSMWGGADFRDEILGGRFPPTEFSVSCEEVNYFSVDYFRTELFWAFCELVLSELTLFSTRSWIIFRWINWTTNSSKNLFEIQNLK